MTTHILTFKAAKESMCAKFQAIDYPELIRHHDLTATLQRQYKQAPPTPSRRLSRHTLLCINCDLKLMQLQSTDYNL